MGSATRTRLQLKMHGSWRPVGANGHGAVPAQCTSASGHSLGYNHVGIPLRGCGLSSEEQGMDDVVIVGAARTPIGTFGGALKDVPAPQLGAVAIRAALQRGGVEPAS